MLTEQQAKAMVDALDVTPVESFFLRCVSRHETSYGAGWNPAHVKSWFSARPPAWHPGINAPWNMGAITTAHPDALSFSHQDSKFDDAAGGVKAYVTWFAGDPTPELGFKRLRDTVLHPNVRAALAEHDFMQGLTCMHENCYFLGIHSRGSPLTDRLNIEDYWNAVVKEAADIGHVTGEDIPEVLA